MLTLRDYQQEASDAAYCFFRNPTKGNGIIIMPTGSGKSILVADIAHRLNEPVLILQPSKEILEQNFAKLQMYGVDDAAIYSASVSARKEIGKFTFATIGSVMPHIKDFDHFRYVLIDECHLVNPNQGQYKTFIQRKPRKVLGLTATPFRLASITTPAKNDDGKMVLGLLNKFHQAIDVLDKDGNPYDTTRLHIGDAVSDAYSPKGFKYHSLTFGVSMTRGGILRFLNRTKPRTFDTVVYCCQISTLMQRGYLAPLTYYDVTPKAFAAYKLKKNSTGMNYDDDSVRAAFENVNMHEHVYRVVNHLLRPQNKRKHILVFCQTVEEALSLSYLFPDSAVVSGDTPKGEREGILAKFKSGAIRVVFNVNVLSVGFDFPDLDTVVLGRPTMSLALLYQQIGRVIRPSNGKTAWVVDCCANLQRFGHVDDLVIDTSDQGLWCVTGLVGGKRVQLTNVTL